MPHFAVQYTYSAATVAGRDEHRPSHRDWLRGLLDRGVLLTSGPFTDDSGALIVVQGDDAQSVKNLFAEDPFAIHELIETSVISEWKPVMGWLSA